MTNKTAYFWGGLGRFIPMLVHMVTTMVLARFLSPSEFGMIGMLSIIFMVANNLLDAGLGGSLINEKSATKADCDTIATFNILMGALLSIIIMILSGRIEVFFKVNGLGEVTAILSIIFFINSWGVVPRAILAKDLKFRAIFISSFLSACFGSISAIVLAAYNFGVYSLVALQLVQSIVLILASIYYSHYWYKPYFSLIRFKHLLPFGIYTTFSNIIDSIYENMLSALFGKHLGATEAGLVYQAKRIEEIASVSLTQTINSVAFPVLAKCSSNTSVFISEAKSIFRNIMLLISPIFVILIVFSETIIKILFGSKWIDAAPYLALLTCASIFVTMENLYRNFIKSSGQAKSLFTITVIKRSIGVILLISCVLISCQYIIYAYILSSIIAYIINVFQYTRIVRLSFLSTLGTGLIYLLPTILFFFSIGGVSLITDQIIISASISVIFYLSYYFWILPRYFGLSIVNLLKKNEK
ncbi:MAG: lipopolysaccharide biosynthesis protein [Aeriscardovia sp.]|nr:lipopolysaccharide biosynthesis protein [Aeriscardovia sp.]